jgi:hypothetical protein
MSEAVTADPSLHVDLAPQRDMYEYACHEGNRGLENILRSARFEETLGAGRDRGR